MKNKVGDKYLTSEGFEVEVIEYFNYKNCTIRFRDNTTVEGISYGNLKKGAVRKPYDRVGEKHINNMGYTVEIIEYIDSTNCTVRFEDGYTSKNRMYRDIKKGQVRNPYQPSFFGRGYLGEGEYKMSVDGVQTQVAITWTNMLQRCYHPKYQEKHPTYIGCSVVEEWLNFQVFAEWFEENYTEVFDLDKDLLLKGNKIYSPETCCFIPREINLLFTRRRNKGGYPAGVSKFRNKYLVRLHTGGETIHLGLFKTFEKALQAYKKAKEKEFKKVANFYKGIISDRVYQALLNYEVSIND